MKKICLIGPVDKRPISYPLIKVLMFLGKTLIVTDDGIYRRFDETYQQRFSFENSDFIVTPTIDKSVLDEVEQIAQSYENILYITTNELPINCDKVISCRGLNKGRLTKEVEKKLEEDSEKVDLTEVYITYSKLPDPSLLKIAPTKNVLTYIYECEDHKDFLATKDPAFSNMLSKFFEKELDLPKATLKGLLLRKG